jgi:AraC-like DNA-binding protein
MSSVFPWFGEALSLLRVYSGPVPESGRKGSFVPSHFTIWHLEEGGFRVDLNRETIRLKAPAWVLMPPGPRRHAAENGTRMMSIHFQLDAKVLMRLGWPPILCCEDVNGALAKEVRALLEAMEATRLGVSLAYLPAVPLSMEEFLAVQGAFLKFLGSFLGVLAPQLQGLEGRDMDPRLELVRRDIAALPLDITPDLDAIAARQGLSLRQLNRLHTQAFSQTCNEYWDQLRAESARIGLANASLTIKQVALSLGFADLAFFSNWFLRHELCRPREFRRRLFESLRSREA